LNAANKKKNERLATMERRITSKPDWTVGRDDLGRAVLEWRLAPEGEAQPAWVVGTSSEDVLNALGAFELELEDESLSRVGAAGFDPYDRCLRLMPRQRK
jgi:hypothetical protein